MNEQRQEILITELDTQVKSALLSIENINNLLNKIESNESIDLDHFWYFAQNLIVYAANISKILWGTNDPRSIEKSKIRVIERTELRRRLQISEDSILKERKLRNALEHIDEKIEDFTKEEKNIIINKSFGESHKILNVDGVSIDFSKEKTLRHYNPTHKTFYYYGQSSNLELLFKNIKKLGENIDSFKTH